MWLSRTSVFGTLAVALLLASCGADEKLRDSMAGVRAKVDGVKRCAPLLGSWPFEGPAYLFSGSKVDALVAAGLVRRVPVKVAPGGRERTRIEITPAGQRDVMIKRLENNVPVHFLCYGQRQVVSVGTDQMKVSAGPSKMEDVVVYKYRIVQAPAWAAREDMRAAFPFMASDLDQVHEADETSPILEIPGTGAFYP